MRFPPFYAHSRGPDPAEWEHLDRHLHQTAARCFEFAQSFDSGEVANLAALWHDLGKYAPRFQKMLHDSTKGMPRDRVDHSTAGALHAIHTLSPHHPMAVPIAFVIAGHHAGLADAGTRESPDESCLVRRIADPPPESIEALSVAPDDAKNQSAPTLPAWFKQSKDAPQLQISILTRMIFSCLIDADRLATEAFGTPEQSALRDGARYPMASYRAALDDYLLKKFQSTDSSLSASPIASIRADLLHTCRDAALRPPGLFSLTAPTGSGKTLSSMAFALAHAERHDLRRVIYALPFTSITEQTAAVFRDAFQSLGDDAVLEHHSAYENPESRTTNGSATSLDDTPTPNEIRRRLAVENWDAPIVVTTNVQLLESLFACDTSTCRKLHRIAKSVIVLDEAQTLTVDLLRPTLAALQELASSYGSTIVLCSATIPAITRRPEFPIGLDPVHEIVPAPEAMSRALRRVEVRTIGELADEDLAAQMASRDRVLTIVNTRKHAARLFQLVQGQAGNTLHLSALMCPAHRSIRVAEIKQRLKDGRPCRVVSTQVVEAGVDIDFPVVYRAMAGLDSIVQAAGRCNREGKLKLGEVMVFETDENPSPGVQAAADVTRQILTGEPDDPTPDPLDLETIKRYFSMLYWTKGGPKPCWDGPIENGRRKEGGITDLLSPKRLAFRTAAGLYKIIDNEASFSLVVPYGERGTELCHRLTLINNYEPGDERKLLRQAQRYTVSVRIYDFQKLIERGLCILTPSGAAVLNDQSLYDENLGLRVDGEADPNRLIV